MVCKKEHTWNTHLDTCNINREKLLSLGEDLAELYQIEMFCTKDIKKLILIINEMRIAIYSNSIELKD